MDALFSRGGRSLFGGDLGLVPFMIHFPHVVLTQMTQESRSRQLNHLLEPATRRDLAYQFVRSSLGWLSFPARYSHS